MPSKEQKKRFKKVMKKYPNVWERLDPNLIRPEKFTAVIEIPKGSKQKYEIDEQTGLLRLDRILFTSTHYPANYGFIPQTLSEDGDALDVLVLCSESLTPMCLVDCYPIGSISMIDQNLKDDKIIAIPFADPTYNSYRDVDALPKHIFDEIEHFFSVYKDLEPGKSVEGATWTGREEAEAEVAESFERAKGTPYEHHHVNLA